MYSVSHSTENWSVFSACRPMRIKATTTGLQAETEKSRDPERRLLTAEDLKKQKKNKLIAPLLASLACSD